MFRNAVVVLAIALVPGSSGLSTGAFARGGGGDGDDVFRGNHFGRRDLKMETRVAVSA
jgi:hypothetical protein